MVLPASESYEGARLNKRSPCIECNAWASLINERSINRQTMECPMNLEKLTTLRSGEKRAGVHSRFLLGTAAIVAIAGGVLASAVPASAVITPHVSVHTYQAYNYADSYGRVQHYDKVGSKTMLANWAPRGTWSNQSSCWGGVTAYWYNFQS